MTEKNAPVATAKAGSPALAVANAVDLVIAYVSGFVAVLSTVIIFLALLADVIVRYMTNRGLGWPSETPQILFPWLIMGGIVLAASRGGHIAVPLLLDTMSKGVARIIVVLMQVVIFIAFAYLARISIDVVNITKNQLFPITRLPQLYSYLALVCGFACVAIISLTTLVRVLHADDARELNVDSGDHTI